MLNFIMLSVTYAVCLSEALLLNVVTLSVIMLSVMAPAYHCRTLRPYLHKRGLFYEPIIVASLLPNIRLGQRCFSASQWVTKARYKLQQ
jgi:hypothetical protein